MSDRSFAFLIRKPRRIRKSMGAINGLYREGVRMRIILLGSESFYWTQEDKQCLERCSQIGVELYTDRLMADGECPGFQVIDSLRVVELIKSADAVIPL